MYDQQKFQENSSPSNLSPVQLTQPAGESVTIHCSARRIMA